MIMEDGASSKSRCIKLSVEEFKAVIEEAKESLDKMVKDLEYMP